MCRNTRLTFTHKRGATRSHDFDYLKISIRNRWRLNFYCNFYKSLYHVSIVPNELESFPKYPSETVHHTWNIFCVTSSHLLFLSTIKLVFFSHPKSISLTGKCQIILCLGNFLASVLTTRPNHTVMTSFGNSLLTTPFLFVPEPFPVSSSIRSYFDSNII